MTLVCFFLISCGESKKKEETETPQTGEAESATFYATSKLNLSQNFDSVTPAGFKAQSTAAGLALTGDNRETVCLGAGARDTNAYEACKLSFEVRDRFFGSSSDNIRSQLKSFEARINGNLARARGGYIPCLDANYTGGETVAIAGDTSSSTLAPAYTEVKIPDYKIFDGSETGVSTGLTLNFSCLEVMKSKGSSFSEQTEEVYDLRVALGLKDGAWSLVEDHGAGGTTIGRIEASGAITLWNGRTQRSKFATAESEVVTAGTDSKPPTIFNDGGSMATIRTLPSQGLIALSAFGENAGDCGIRMIMNSRALYFKAGINRYGACFDGDIFDKYTRDTTSSIDSGNRGVFRETWENIDMCLEVDGEAPKVANAGMQHCVDAGLVTYESNGTSIADPFASIGLPLLTASGPRAPTGALKLRGWMGGQMHRFLDLSAVPTLGWVALSPNAKIEAVEGYESATYLFKNSSDEVSKNIAQTALCSADEATRTQSFKQIYILSIADILSNVPADPEGNFDLQKELFLKSLNQAMTQTESVAPKLSTKISGVVGINHRSLISGTVTLKLGDSVLGTGAFQGTDSGLVNSADVNFTPTSVPEIKSDSVIQAEISGNLTLKCNTDQGTQTAAAIIGNPSLAWFIKPMIDDKQTP